MCTHLLGTKSRGTSLRGHTNLQQKLAIKRSTQMNATLFRAVEASDVPALRTLLATDSLTVAMHSTDGKGCSPLFHVHDSATAAFLLNSCNADANARNSAGETPLFYAVRGARSTQIATLLLDNGADVNVRNERQETALFDANSADMVRLLVQRGADVHTLSKSNYTPLFSAARFNHVDAAKELINAGSDVHHLDSFGQTAMFGFGLNVPMIELLIRHGASVYTVSNNGGTVMHQAAIYGHLDVIYSLFEHGAAIDVVSSTNATPLCEAASRGRCEIVLFLLENGARVHGDPSFKKLPVLAAARNGHLTVATELLARGASFSPEKDDGAQHIGESSSGNVPLSHAHVVDLMIKHCDRVVPTLISSASSVFTTWLRLLQRDLNMVTRKLESIWTPIVLKLNTVLAIMKNGVSTKPDRALLVRFGETVLCLWRWTLEYTTRKSSVEQILYSNLFTPQDMDTMILLREMISEFQVTGKSITLNRNEDPDETSWRRLIFTCSKPMRLLRATNDAPEKLKAFVLGQIRNGGGKTEKHSREGHHDVWDALRAAAYGLVLLHKQGFVHGELAPSEINSETNDGDDNQVAAQVSKQKLDTEPIESEPSSPAPATETKTKTESEAARWGSPELLKDEDATASFTSDVYAFGMCILEAVSGERPWGRVSSGVVCVLVGLGRLPRQPECFSGEQWQLIEAMCARDPATRPDMTFVAGRLHFIMKQLQGHS